MGDDAGIIRTADICDDHEHDVRICEMTFNDYAKRRHFHGEVVTFATYEDNKGVRDVLKEGGKGKVLVVDGRGSMRRALCGGNIGLEAFENGWAGLVFNGVIRDQHEFADLDFGVKAIGTTGQRPRQNGIGIVGAELNFGNILIRPGDYLYADVDCVLVLDKPVHG